MIESGIAVVGTGEVKGTPDTVVVQIGVSVTRSSVAEATRDAAARGRAVIAALADRGVAENDIQTSNLSVSPNYEHHPNRQPKLTGYTFTNTVTAAIRSLDAAGDILDAALAAGGDDAIMHGLSFALEDDTQAAVQARASAFADARSKAEQLAALAGVGLGVAVAIEEMERGGSFPTPPTRMFRVAAEAAATPVAAGQVTTTISVSVRFAIK